MTAEEMAKGAAEWFGSLGRSWPTESVADIARQNNAAKVADPSSYENPAYYGISAVLLMLCAVHSGEWPPMSPGSFARSLTDPRIVKQIARYAKNVSIVEIKREGGGAYGGH